MLLKNTKIIAIDFDGTLDVKDVFPDFSRPRLWLINLLKRMKRDENVKLILWTCREGDVLDDAVDWCHDFGLTFDAINENVPEIAKLYGKNGRKPAADIYIDEKSIQPETLQRIMLVNGGKL